METKIATGTNELIKVAFVGPESTGKTTISEQLAQYHNTQWVPEYMRLYLQQKWDIFKQTCTWADLLPIAKGQLQLEAEAAAKAHHYLFCDTCLIELAIYAHYYYNRCPAPIERALETTHYQHIFLTYLDPPWVADDLRDRPHNRAEIFDFFQQKLLEYGFPYTVLKGDLQERMEVVNMHLEMPSL